MHEDERWLIRESGELTVDFDRETGLKAGDTIDILMQGSRKRLLLIHCIEIASEPINQIDMKRRKREASIQLIFSRLQCCGFGAVLLLFVLTVGKKSDTMVDIEAKTEEIIGQMENDIADKDSELKSLQRSLTTIGGIATPPSRLKRKRDADGTRRRVSFVASSIGLDGRGLRKAFRRQRKHAHAGRGGPIPIPNAVKSST